MDKEKSDENKAKKKSWWTKKNYIAYFCIFSKWKDVFPSINFYPSGFDHLTFTFKLRLQARMYSRFVTPAHNEPLHNFPGQTYRLNLSKPALLEHHIILYF